MNSQRVFLTAEWRWLAMLNYEVDPGLLLPFVPFGQNWIDGMAKCLPVWLGSVF